MPDLLISLQGLPSLLIYLVTATIVAGETAVIFGLLVPGEATLLLVMAGAAVIGDTLAFRAGRRYGPRLRASGLGARVGPDRWRRADTLLARLGGRGVLAARWVAFARTLVPRLAGAAGLPYRRFAPWNLAGAATWVAGSILLGYLAGESYERVSRLLGRATGAVLVLLLCLAAVVLAGRWLGRNPDPVRALAARAAGLRPLRWLRGRYGVLFFLVAMRLGPAWTLLLNLAAGLLLLFTAGLLVAVTLETVVGHSGLAVVDGLIADWFADRRTPGVVQAALGTASALRGSFLIAVVAAVAAVLAWRSRPWRADLLSVVGTVGAFVPLVVLAVVADLTGPGGPGDVPTLFPTQNAVVTASLCTLAWLLSRGARWPVAVAVWTVAAAGVVSIGGARLYLGWSTASGTATSVLLGAAWTTVFMVAWATRDRAVGADAPTGAGDPSAATGDRGDEARPPRPRRSGPPSRVPRRPDGPA